MDTTPALTSNWRGFAFWGYVVIFLTFGVCGGWAAITKIDQAVVASATISIETNRKVVQHFEGGIVSEILIKEGDRVAAGQILVRMTKVQAQANNEQLLSQLAANVAIETRLVAERENATEIKWPIELEQRKVDANVSRAMADQAAVFGERRLSLRGQVDVLESRIKQLETEIQGHEVEKKSTTEQVAYINKELVGLRRLGDEELIPLTRLYAMERERTRLEGVIGRSTADIAKAHGQISEMTIQIKQLTKKFQEDVGTQLSDVRQKINELRERVTVSRDILSRVDVVSPRAGTVQNLKIYANGQVIRSGEPLMEIVPGDEPLVVLAQFSPLDIDGVRSGQEVEIRFPAFHSRTLPVMIGHLESVSHDRLTDETTKQPYFLGRVSIDQAQIPDDLRIRLRSGMPAEVIAASGERTVINYIVSPLSNSMRKAFRER